MTQPTEFGIDLLRVATKSPVHILKVTLIGAMGLRLTDLLFTPGADVGGGYRYGDPHALEFPAEWAARRSMPNAELVPLTATSTLVHGTWSRDPVWNAVVGVLPTSEAGGTAKGVRFTYLSGTHTGTINGVVSFGVRPSSSVPCARAE